MMERSYFREGEPATGVGAKVAVEFSESTKKRKTPEHPEEDTENKGVLTPRVTPATSDRPDKVGRYRSPSSPLEPIKLPEMKNVPPAYMNLDGFGTGKPIPAALSLWLCLCCGRPECGFESGVTIMKEEDGQDREDDPCEIDNEKSTGMKEKDFNEESEAIRDCVSGLLRSKKFFGWNKYVGTASLDKKLKTWLKSKIKEETVDKNWVALEGRRKKLCDSNDKTALVSWKKSTLVSIFCAMIGKGPEEPTN